jgi:hypothetical protein
LKVEEKEWEKKKKFISQTKFSKPGGRGGGRIEGGFSPSPKLSLNIEILL